MENAAAAAAQDGAVAVSGPAEIGGECAWQQAATLKEVAFLLRCSDKTVRRLYSRGALLAFRLDESKETSQLRFPLGPNGKPIRLTPPRPPAPVSGPSRAAAPPPSVAPRRTTGRRAR
jgi:hypothetical protein